MEWKKIVTGTLGLLWAAARIIGLAGLPADFDMVVRILGMIPDWIGGPLFGIFLVLSWQQWGYRMRAAIRKILGQARERFRIGSTDYVPFDNLIEITSSIAMQPLGTDGIRVGKLPEGTNLVCLPNGRVRLALPVRIKPLGLELDVGNPEVSIEIDGATHLSRVHKDND